MAYKNLNEFISLLEQAGELIRVKKFVDPVLEIAEITDRFSKLPGGGKALLFENTGTEFPVLTNAMGSEKRICMALGVNNLSDFGLEIQGLMNLLTTKKETFFDKIKVLPQLGKIAKWMPKSIAGKGKCQEIIHLKPDLSVLPILKCWPADGGRFVTLPMVHTIDPVNGSRNVGMYRMQVLDSNTTGMHWHVHKTGAKHFRGYKKAGKKMPIAVALGGDLAYTYSATAPLPDGIDEYILAGFIRKKPVEMVKCITQDMEVPSDVDIVMEGYVDTSEDLFWEGPFGDHTGFYSLEDWYPKFHVTCITHRNNAVYPATIVGIPPQEDAWIAEATGKIFFTPIKFSFAPELVSMDLPVAGVAHNLALLSIENTYPGQAFKVINALWGAGQMMFNKVMVVVNKSDSKLTYKELFAKIIKNIQIPNDLLFSKGPLDVLDHASDVFAFGGKVGIDATSISLEGSNSPLLEPIKYENGFGNPSVEKFQTAWLEKGVPVILFSLNKECKANPNHLLCEIAKDKNLQKVKVFICFNSGVDLENEFLLTWLFLGNIDPVRDMIVLLRHPNGENCLLIDATSKTNDIHKFVRPWPNVVTSSNETINEIDERWNEIFTMEKIPSPSLIYKHLIESTESTAHTNN
jgi:4-hydroxy-3-polyprenylbenzoate decarboxylase